MLVLVALIALLSIDSSLKKSGQTIGFYPEKAQWVFVSKDIALSWRRLKSTDSAKSFLEDLSTQNNPERMFQLAIRKSTGIRPTPSRLRAWMGHSIILAHADDSTLLCMQPGILMRCLELINSAGAIRTPFEGVKAYKKVHYAWRDGFLIVSDDLALIESALVVPPLTVSELSSEHSTTIIVTEPDITVGFTANEGIEIQCRFRTALPLPTDQILTTKQMPFEPIASLTMSGDLTEKLLGKYKTLITGPAAQFLDTLVAPLSVSGAVKQVEIHLISIDDTGNMPVPELALIVTPEAISPTSFVDTLLLNENDTIPFEWNDRRGVMIPVAGVKLTICMVPSGPALLITSTENAMANLAGKLQGGISTKGASMEFIGDWNKIADSTRALLEWAATAELLPNTNTEDLRKDWLPYLTALAECGSIKFTGTSKEGYYVCSGTAFSPNPLVEEKAN